MGNFGWVIEEVWKQAYEPMIGALERHPGVQLGLHYSGPLLEWMDRHQPSGIERIAALVERSQVELLGGGWYEPILVALPQADRHGQLVRMREELKRRFGVKARGAWLAERVWEPTLASDLAGAGYEYSVVDDDHLRAAGVLDESMWGTYTVDDQGRRLTIFATEKGLRYAIPWRPVPEVIEHLAAKATADGTRLGTMGDDGEKFGAWPDTYRLSWGRDGWVEEFFRALDENVDWLRTVRPSDWLDEQPPLGRVAMPTGSYVEMSEWALEPSDAVLFHDLLAAAQERGDGSERFLRGGTWRAFQARYQEVNDLHKQMLRASAKVNALPAGDLRERALDHLYRGQSNDVYWHGLFGGVYLADLRVAVLSELIAAEDLADAGTIPTAMADLDLDGRDEVLLGGPGQSVLVDPADGGGIGAWDLLASRVPLASVLRRRPEASHHKLVVPQPLAAAVANPDEPLNPHEPTGQDRSDLARFLVYDRHERRSALVHLLGAEAAAVLGPEELSREEAVDLADTVSEPYEIDAVGDGSCVLRREASVLVGADRVRLTVTKRIELSGDRMAPVLAIEIDVDAPDGPIVEAELDLEWNLNLLGGGANPQAWYELSDPESGGPVRCAHDSQGDAPGVHRLAFGNDHLGVSAVASPEPPCRATWFPIETVSNSEAGFERTYQGSSLHLRWPITVGEGPARVALRMEVRQSRDLSA